MNKHSQAWGARSVEGTIASRLFAALKGACFSPHAAHGLGRRVAAVRNTSSGRLLGCGPQPTSKTPPLAPAAECYRLSARLPDTINAIVFPAVLYAALSKSAAREIIIEGKEHHYPGGTIRMNQLHREDVTYC
jgi:hypothetical protein